MRSNFLDTTLCKVCNKTLDRSEAVINKRTGYIKESICPACRYERFQQMRRNNNLRVPSEYRKFLKEVCERCGFKGKICQMDIDHIDSNHRNNIESNLRTLCANCHRLVTFSPLDVDDTVMLK